MKRNWSEIPPDALVEVFKRFPVKDRLRTIPQVCKAWRKATRDPGCWQVVDLKKWCMLHSEIYIHRMIRLVVEMSCGGIRELHVANLETDTTLQFLKQCRLNSLKALSIPSSDVTDSGLCELIRTLPTLEHLDISDCNFVTSTALEILGQTCKLLTRLDRVMSRASGYARGIRSRSSSDRDDSEAMAIAKHMPKLKHLEVTSGWLSKSNYTAILQKCPGLELVEIDLDPYDYYMSDSDDSDIPYDHELYDDWSSW